MNDFTVKRRLTEVLPNSVELGNKINKGLNIIFITWSVLVIIMYFSGVELPNYIDVTVSIIAIGIAVSHQLYTYIAYRKSGIRKIGIMPTPVFKSNLDPLELNQINLIL